jgi:hypothetical protein
MIKDYRANAPNLLVNYIRYEDFRANAPFEKNIIFNNYFSNKKGALAL